MAGLLLAVSVAGAENDRENKERPEWNKTTQGERRGFTVEQKEAREAFRAEIDTERKIFHDSLKADRQAFQAELKSAKEEFKQAREERKEEFKNNAKNMIGERFEVAVRNLERMQERIGDLIDVVAEDETKDTALAEELLELSKTILNEAKEKIEDIKDLIPEEGEEVTPEIFEQIKLAARDAKNLLKESHRALIDSLKTIKALKNEDDDDEEDDDEDED